MALNDLRVRPVYLRLTFQSVVKVAPMPSSRRALTIWKRSSMKAIVHTIVFIPRALGTGRVDYAISAGFKYCGRWPTMPCGSLLFTSGLRSPLRSTALCTLCRVGEPACIYDCKLRECRAMSLLSICFMEFQTSMHGGMLAAIHMWASDHGPSWSIYAVRVGEQLSVERYL